MFDLFTQSIELSFSKRMPNTSFSIYFDKLFMAQCFVVGGVAHQGGRSTCSSIFRHVREMDQQVRQQEMGTLTSASYYLGICHLKENRFEVNFLDRECSPQFNHWSTFTYLLKICLYHLKMCLDENV